MSACWGGCPPKTTPLLVCTCVRIAGAEHHQDLNRGSVRVCALQVLRVRAPWIRAAYMCGDTYIIPNRDTVVLGGTGQVGRLAWACSAGRV